MAANQGINKFTRGFERKLTASEMGRGYLFISLDRKVKSISNLKILINNSVYINKEIDNSGRIGIGKEIIRDISGGVVSFKLIENTLHISY